jgi:glycosyltransferase involved in cell wall biosynthesis
MRIVQALGWYYPDSLGGTEVYVAGLSKWLAARGHEVAIAAPDAACHTARTYEHDGLQVYRYPIPGAPTRNEAQGRVPVRGAEHFANWIRTQRPDVVHVHSFVTGLGLSELRVARATGARVVTTSHVSSLGWICQRGTMMRWGTRLCDGIAQPKKCAACSFQHRGVPRLLAPLLAVTPAAVGRLARTIPGKLGTTLSMRDLIARNLIMQREMLDTVDRFVVLTQWALDTLLANGAPRGKLALNRLGHSWPLVRRKLGPDVNPTTRPVKIGYLGRFESIKGVYDLVRAVRSLPPDMPIQIELRGPVRTHAERRVVERLRVIASDDPRITLSREVAPEDVQEVLKNYDVLCCPALCFEGGPTVAIEAHAVGTPVIGSRIGGLAELVADGVNGQLVPAGHWRKLAVVLRKIAVEPGNTIDRWRTALPSARTMDAVALDYLKLYSVLA